MVGSRVWRFPWQHWVHSWQLPSYLQPPPPEFALPQRRWTWTAEQTASGPSDCRAVCVCVWGGGGEVRSYYKFVMYGFLPLSCIQFPRLSVLPVSPSHMSNVFLQTSAIIMQACVPRPLLPEPVPETVWWARSVLSGCLVAPRHDTGGTSRLDCHETPSDDAQSPTSGVQSSPTAE